jgi:predicted nucleic acid-binding protein
VACVERPKVYLESSVISYLAARPSRDILATAHQQVTREWWDRSRSRFDLFVSGEVLNEIRRGDPTASQLRLQYVRDLPVLEVDDQAQLLAAEILRTSALPRKAAADAAHIAIATVNGMDFLLTWNCTHIANGFVQRAISRLSREMGFEPPTIVTPEELTEP